MREKHRGYTHTMVIRKREKGGGSTTVKRISVCIYDPGSTAIKMRI